MRLALLTLLLAGSASAQSAPDSAEVGRIVGMVTDASYGGGLIGATVEIASLGRSAVTAPDGHFEIDDVPVGRYVAQARHVGYSSVEVEVTVRQGRTTGVRAELPPVLLCEVFILYGQELVSRGVYAPRVASYPVRRGGYVSWEEGPCRAWEEPDPSPMLHARTR